MSLPIKPIQNFKGHTSLPHALASQESPPRLFSASWDGTIKEWDITPGSQLQSPIGQNTKINKDFLSLAILPGTTTRLFSGDTGFFVKEWNVSAKNFIVTQNFTGHTKNVNVVFVTSNTTQPRLFSGSDDSIIIEWDLHTGLSIKSIDNTSPVNCITILDGISPRLFAGGQDGLVRVWDISGSEISTPIQMFNHGTPIYSIVSFISKQGNPRLFSAG
ncbi:hypothetical protein HK096_003546, partial [Nowakowskiella sp. JEL0078]